MQDLTFVHAMISDELIRPHQQQQRVDPRVLALWAQQAGSQWRGAAVVLAAAGAHSCTRHHPTAAAAVGLWQAGVLQSLPRGPPGPAAAADGVLAEEALFACWRQHGDSMGWHIC